MESYSLFDDGDMIHRFPLAERLQRLAARGIYWGTSSWKYPGWLGSIYTAERYLTRGRFSQKKFEEACLAEYAETFPIVCGDFSFYQFPSAVYWSRLFSSCPPGLKFAFKVPEQITVRTWPPHARYGARRGLENESFLDAVLFERMFANPLVPYAKRVAVLIFEFATLPKLTYPDVEAFAADLDRFLSSLPCGWRYAVEVRNPEYLARPYFDCLRRHGVAHVFNAWTRMPELGVQMAIDDAYTASHLVVRALLRSGRTYEQAVAKFQPYAQIQDPNPAGREALRQVIERAWSDRRSAFVFVNNRFEGNGPATIAAVVNQLV